MIEIDRLVQLPFLDVLALGVRYVNRARPDQQRLAPVRQLGNIGCECCDHGGQSVDRAQA